MRAFDIALVKNLIDPYLFRTITKKVYDPTTGAMNDEVRPVVVDDGALPGNDPMMKSSQSDTALLLRGIGGTNSGEDWWYEYGRRVHDRFLNVGPMGIRCDTCTALAFYLLRSNGFSAAISVIEQAMGNANGHWFLLMGCPYDATIQYPNRFPRGCFAVDLWGIGVMRQRGETTSTTSVIDPASCCYSCGDNSLKRKIHREGLTTVMDRDQFVYRTNMLAGPGGTVRSPDLVALDQRLHQYHQGAANLNQLVQAFNAVTPPAHARGQMRALQNQIRWLGGAV